MFKLKFTLCFVILFLQILSISAQSTTGSSNANGLQPSPTVSPANTATSTPTSTPNPATTPQTTATPPKTDSPITRIPSENGEAKITFLGTNETDKNKLTLKVSYTDEKSSSPQKKTFLVSNAELKSLLGKFKEGDKVLLEYTKEKDGDVLKDIEVKSVTTNLIFPIFFMLILLFGGMCLGKNLILGEDGLYSKSKFQIVLWFFVLIGIYLVVNIFRAYYGDFSFIGGVSIPTNLLLLTGLSSLTFVGAKAIAENKAPKTTAVAEAAVAKVEKPTNNNPRFFYDLFHGDIPTGVKPTGEVEKVQKLNTDGKPMMANDKPVMEEKAKTVATRNLDLGDFQMVIITLLAVAVYIVQAISFTQNIELHQFITLPDVDSTILAAFGLGQGAYLVKKYAE